jgi:subtilisin family serine protease
MLLTLWPRPHAPAVGSREIELCRQQELRLASAPEQEVSDLDCARPWQSEDRIPGRYVIGFAPGQANPVGAWVQAGGGRVRRTDDAGSFVVAEFPVAADGAALAAAAAASPQIRYFEPDLRVRAAKIPDDPYFLSHQWDKWVMYADEAWEMAGSGKVKVGIVDNGVEYNHPDLAANFVTGEVGYDFVNNDEDPRPDNPNISQAFHGTHVSGIVSATMDNRQGIAGWTATQLVAARVLDDSGQGNTSTLAAGIRWAADQGCRIINMSLGASSAPSPVVEACNYAAGRGAVLVAASGNEGNNAVNYPAALSQCIAVGSVSKESRLSSFSNHGPEQELVAPGEAIPSAVPGGAYGSADGTSMASPQVAGVAALVLSLDTSMTATRVRAILDAAAIDMGSAGRDQTYGFGLLNARRALELAQVLVRAGAVSTRPGARPATVVRGAGEVFDALGRRVEPGRTRVGVYFSSRGRRLVVVR